MVIRHIASLWTLREYPTATDCWSIERQLDEICAAGFDGITGRITVEIGRKAREKGLLVCGFISSGNPSDFRSLMEEQHQAGAKRINVQLADDDTSTEEALRLTLLLLEEGGRWPEIDLSIEIHRDTCTETPEKVYALADRYEQVAGKKLKLTWDFSHLAVVKHLAPQNFSSRLLVRKELIRIADQFHLRPFNGHHCQVPVTNGKSELTKEFLEWIPFVHDLFKLLLSAPPDGEREIFIVPEMGPVSSGYNLEQLPPAWEDAKRLRELLEGCWRSGAV